MLDKLLTFIAPHLCSGCGKLGSLLCSDCKYDIISEPYDACIACGRPAGKNGICTQCNVAYEQAWCVGERTDTLERLIGVYKFNNAFAAHRSLTELLDARLPGLPEKVVIVPVPTVSSHIRQRGYDHALLLARSVAKQRSLPVDQLLGRKTNTKQRGAGRTLRIQQAKEAFVCKRQPDPDTTYLLIDDVITTGATLNYAAHCLQEAGAQHVWVAAIAHQPLD